MTEANAHIQTRYSKSCAANRGSSCFSHIALLKFNCGTALSLQFAKVPLSRILMNAKRLAAAHVLRIQSHVCVATLLSAAELLSVVKFPPLLLRRGSILSPAVAF